MKLKGKPLSDAAKAVIAERSKVEREKAEKEVARKLNHLLDQAKHMQGTIDSYEKALAAAIAKRQGLVDRIRRIKDGDETALDDPKDEANEIRWAVPSSSWYSNSDRDQQMIRMMRRYPF